MININIGEVPSATYLPLSGGTLTGTLTLGDNVKLILGTGSDAEIYYNGSDLIIDPDVVGSGLVNIKGRVRLLDDMIVALDSSDLINLVARSTALAANTTLGSIIEGATPKTFAVAAGSMLIANVVNDGDIELIVSKAGISHAAFLADGSTGDTAVQAASGQSFDVYVAGTKILDYASGAFAFQENTTISSTGTLTIGAATLSGAIAGGDQAFTNVGDMTFATGSILASGSTNGNTLLIRANDTTFITLTTGATDACTMDAITMSGTWLASGTVTIPAITLGGTIDLSANIFTNSFEMYRALFRETMYGSHFDATGGNSALTGTGSVSVGENGIYMATGTTHASSAGRRATPHAITAGGTNWGSINWGKKFFVAFTLVWTGATGTNLIFRFHVTQATTVGALAAHGLGLQTNGTNINLVTYGANGAVATVSGATDLVLSKRVWVLIEHDPAVADRLYVNNVLIATQSTAGDIPSTEPSAAYYLHPSIARSGGADVGVEEARWYNIQYGQEA